MHGPNLPVLAWRNLWRQKRRTILTLLSIAFGVFLSILATSAQDRSFSDFIDSAARLGGGHVCIQDTDYQDTPSLTHTITRTNELRAIAAQVPGVGTVVDRITGQAMLSTSSDSFGVTFIAYDPKAENEKTFSLIKALRKGAVFETSHDKGIILGKKLAANLKAEIGDKVVYTMMDKQGEVVAGMARLTGVIATNAPSLDSALCLLPIDVVRDMIGYAPDEATQVAVFLSDSRRSATVARDLQWRLPGWDLVVLTWDEIAPDLRSFIALKVGGGRVMEIIIGLLIAAGIFNTLFVSVMERVREFGIQLALGWTPGQLFRMVMWESLWLALVGLATGALLVIGPYKHLAETGIDMSKNFGEATEISGVGFEMVLRVGIYPENAAIIAFAFLFATLAAGLYPAWKACRVEPVETIKLV